MSGGFGKIPGKADFVRVGESDGQTRQFESWLDDSCLRLRESALELPDAAVRFIVHGAGESTAMVGILRRSRDSVGRSFPFSVFTSLDWRAVQHRWSALPVAMWPTLEASDQLIADAAHLDVEAVRRRVQTLWTPGSEDLEEADAVCRKVLEQTPWLEVVQRVLGPTTAIEHASYAFRTLRAALARPQGAFECPIDVDVDLFFWLELVRRLARSDSMTLVWTEEPTPRLIVSVGQPIHVLLVALATVGKEHSQIWPLRTQRPAALEAAHKAYGPLLEPVRGASIEALFQTIVQAGDV